MNKFGLNLVAEVRRQSQLHTSLLLEEKKYTHHFLPSTMIMWYPNSVLASPYLGLAVVLFSRP